MIFVSKDFKDMFARGSGYFQRGDLDREEGFQGGDVGLVFGFRVVGVEVLVGGTVVAGFDVEVGGEAEGPLGGGVC